VDFRSYASSSRGNCYEIRSTGGTRLLLEAGLPIAELRRRTGFGLSAMDAVLITHEHGDHARAASDLLRAAVPVWCSAGTALALGLSGCRVLHEIDQVRVGDVSVLPFATQHDAAEPLGFLLSDGIDKLLFATDTGYLRWRFSGLTMIAIECNFALDLLPADLAPSRRRRLDETHMSLTAVREMLAANDLRAVREIRLLHLSASHSDADRFRREIEGQTGLPVTVEEE